MLDYRESFIAGYKCLVDNIFILMRSHAEGWLKRNRHAMHILASTLPLTVTPPPSLAAAKNAQPYFIYATYFRFEHAI